MDRVRVREEIVREEILREEILREESGKRVILKKGESNI